jgi:hypothetical protein
LGYVLTREDKIAVRVRIEDLPAMPNKKLIKVAKFLGVQDADNKSRGEIMADLQRILPPSPKKQIVGLDP